MGKIVLKNGTIVNEGIVQEKDILIVDDVISKIADDISDAAAEVIDVAGMHILPGVIDDQVHFREPGLTHKGTIATESRAALAGGITTFMEQPNTTPQTTTIEKLEEKFATASNSAFANYSFLFGGTNDNLEELKRLDKNACSGIKLFLGSSTGNMLVDDEKVIENIFSNTEMVISAHCEDETTIRENLAKYKAEYGDDIPVEMHPNDIPLGQKKITAEVCIHHLWFSDADYANKGTLIKWNPAVKTAKDRVMLWNALLDDRIDVIATDHAPHLLEEKNNVYTKAPSGGPLVQHALNAMLEKVKDGTITLEKMVQKMCHNPAILFQIEKRGYIREGYYADLVVANLNSPWTVSKENIAYKCKWSPFEDTTFSSKVVHTFINGHLGYSNGVFSEKRNAKRLTFNRS